MASAPALLRVRLVSVAAKNALGTQSGIELNVKIDKNIEVGVGDNPDQGRFIPIVRMVVSAHVWPKEEDKAGSKQLSALASYEAVFTQLPQGVSLDTAKSLVDVALASGLVSQAHPLVMAHFLAQLSLMGLNTAKIPLGLEGEVSTEETKVSKPILTDRKRARKSPGGIRPRDP